MPVGDPVMFSGRLKTRSGHDYLLKWKDFTEPFIVHFTHSVFAASHELFLGRSDDLHFRMFSLNFQGDVHLLGAAGAESGVLAHPFRRNLTVHDLKDISYVIIGLKSPDIDVPAALNNFPHVHQVIFEIF